MSINIQEFLTTVHQESLDTARIPLPAGDYTGQIGTDDKAIALVEGTAGPSAKNPGAPWKRLDINITIPDPSGSLKAATGRDPVVVRHGIMLNLTPDGSIDWSTGKNIDVGRLFKAAGWSVSPKGQLAPGWSVDFLLGKTIKVKMIQEPNPNDPTSPYERVSAVTVA